MSKPTAVTHTGDRILDAVQRNVQRPTVPFLEGRMLTGTPDAQGRLSDGIACTAGTAQSIAHGLGRPALGFIEVCPAHIASSASPALRASYASTTNLSREIRFTPGNSGTCWIWVF